MRCFIIEEFRLYDLAKIIRSKNSGPFEITLDVIFDDKNLYEKIKNSNVITKDVISNIYGLSEDSISEIVFFDPALGLKITYDRKISSGTVLDTDVYGAQQHIPLGNLKICI